MSARRKSAAEESPGTFGKSGRNRDGNGLAARLHGKAIARDRGVPRSHEFVAANPAQEIGFADDLFRASGEAFQNAISGGVAMPVVDRFVTVEIENHRAKRASARPIEKRAEMGFEAAAIFQPGQRIGGRHFDRGFDIVAQTVGISLPPDLRAHASGKFVAIDRAQDIVVHAKIEAAQDLLAILGVGDRQHRDLAGALPGSEPRAKPEPVVVREIETDDEEVVIAGGTRVERLAAIAFELEFEFDIMARNSSRMSRSREGMDPREERYLVDRLGEEIIGAGIEPAHPVGGLIERRHHHHGNMRGCLVPFQTAADFQSA